MNATTVVLFMAIFASVGIAVGVLGLEARVYRTMPDFSGRVSVAGLLVIVLIAGVLLATNSVMVSVALVMGWWTL
ncbi:MAG: hypothetical protein M9936_31370 [Caldilinea sp.]|nr:hypothetical protein [Caldilinea sp.]MCO5214223.1 hypothetical protein [Caldilinea sp.]MCW5844349.1 hypothetical protein [Caldilinea sp.]